MSLSVTAASIRAVRAHLAANPDDARSKDRPATAVLTDGLRCRVDDPAGAIVSDMPKALGGGGTAPSPGWLMRSAHALCDATVIAMRAAEEGVALTKLEVTVDSDSDDRGLVGAADGVPAGPLETRVRIAIAADNADEQRLRDIVEYALEHSPVGSAIGRAVQLTSSVEVG